MMFTDLLYKFAAGGRVGKDQSVTSGRIDNCSTAIRQREADGRRFSGYALGRSSTVSGTIGRSLHVHGSEGRK